MKKTLLIHEITEEILKLPLQDYILTFDDGLYSQYYYWPEIEKIKTKKYFFISGLYVSTSLLPRRNINHFLPKPDNLFMDCYEARRRFNKSNGICNSQYMSICEILNIKGDDVVIGGHGYAHIRDYPTNIINKIKVMKEDVKLMIEWFHMKLNMKPKIYSYPYEKEDKLLGTILGGEGIGVMTNRIPVEKLL